VRTSGVAIALISCVLAAPLAHACGQGKLLYQDDFKTLDPAWNAPDSVTVADGAMDVKLGTGATLTLISQANLFTQPSVEVCVTFKIVSGLGTADDPSVYGPVFWADGLTNFNSVQVLPAAGTVRANLYNGKWETRVGAHPVAQNTAAGDKNETDLTITSTKAQMTLNGKQAVYMIGAPPTGGWMVGMHLEAPNAGPAEFQITDFEVRAGQ
jgi:hypothetical protein